MPLLNVPGSQNNLNITVEGLEPETIGAIPVSQKGQPNGVPTLNEQGQVPTHQLPSFHVPTLAELGGEPAGAASQAISAHKAESEPHGQYALGLELDSHINSTNNPHQVTRAQLGAEPAGAEERAKAHAEQLIAALKTRSANPPSNPSEGHIWEQVDTSSNSVMHTWVRQGALWRSHSMNLRSNLFWISAATDDLVTKRNWEIEIYPNMPFAASKILISYLQIGFVAYNAVQNANNFWSFLLFGTDGNNIENYWAQLDFKENIPTQTRTTKNIYVGADLGLNAQLRRLRVEARATGAPGLILARANLGYIFTR